MSLDDDYKDFRAYFLEDSGEKMEFEAEVDAIQEKLESEAVLLLVRFDLRRIFIWKGPKSPVRKRFISSRVAAEIQAESNKVGMHLKIISVDAGDEPVEFLTAFNCESYQVSDDEKPEDMYYIRNDERRKMEEEAIKDQMKEKETKKEYWSPALGSASQGDFGEEAKKKAAMKAKKLAKETPSPAMQPVSAPKRTSMRRQAPPNSSSHATSSAMSEDEEKAILEEVLKSDLPENMKRLNIIIGTALYGPQKVISKIFGKDVESEEWSKIAKIPDGTIDIDAGQLRAVVKNNMIQALEVLQKNGETKTSKEKSKETKKETESAPKKRELQPIPRGE